jgi:hypothetical protein
MITSTAHEAYGAFRLPVPPESGYMPGVLVKNEPFVALAEELELRRQACANLNDIQWETLEQAVQKSQFGRKIAFQSDRSGNFDIYVININGGNLERITTHPAYDGEPAWSLH